MDASKLNKRVTFQVATANSGDAPTWADSFTVWAAIQPLVGARRYQAQQLNSEIAGKVVIRYRSDVTASMRIEFGTRYLHILSIVNPNEANQWLEIEYKEAQD